MRKINIKGLVKALEILAKKASELENQIKNR